MLYIYPCAPLLRQFYALSVWTGVGYVTWVATRPLTPEQKEEQTEEERLRREAGGFDEIKEGSAMWWVTTLKSPEQMQNTEGIKVFRFKGLSYRGSEDLTLATKEAGQTATANMLGGKDVGLTGREDIYLRRYHQIPMAWDGGPSPAQLMADFKAEGRNYELEMDFANRAFGITTRYNADGTVGKMVETVADMPTVEEVEENRRKIDGADWVDSKETTLDMVGKVMGTAETTLDMS
jgi:hypothetical protein